MKHFNMELSGEEPEVQTVGVHVTLDQDGGRALQKPAEEPATGKGGQRIGGQEVLKSRIFFWTTNS